jgi:hypothetical protein
MLHEVPNGIGPEKSSGIAMLVSQARMKNCGRRTAPTSAHGRESPHAAAWEFWRTSARLADTFFATIPKLPLPRTWEYTILTTFPKSSLSTVAIPSPPLSSTSELLMFTPRVVAVMPLPTLSRIVESRTRMRVPRTPTPLSVIVESATRIPADLSAVDAGRSMCRKS